MLKGFATIVLLVLAWLVASGVGERKFLYPFDPTRAEPPAGFAAHELPTPDGAVLVVWTHPPARGKPVIVYFHGNAGNLAIRSGRFEAFAKRGYGVVAPAYRGSSGSTGEPSEKALLADAEQVAAALPGLVGDGPVIYYGESLGAAVAVALAERRPPAALVLEAPFTSLYDMAQALYGAGDLVRLLNSRWDSIARIPRVTAPLLILHGAADELIPPDQGRALYAAAGSAEKTFYLVPGAGHTNVWQPDAQRVLYRFLGRF